MLGQIASYVFLGSLFGELVVWGFLPSLWIMQWPQMVLLGLAAAGLIVWGVFSLDRILLWAKKRSTQFGISMVITAVMSLVILGSINWWATQNNSKIDLTEKRLYTLSDQSLKVARELKEDVTIRVWTRAIDRMSANIEMRKWLENYQTAARGKIKIEVMNPIDDRVNSEKDGIKRDNVIIIRSASNREARIESFTDTKGEEQITNGIIQVVKGAGKKMVCFLTGHGELSTSNNEPEGLSKIKQRMTDSNYDSKEITLASESSVPKDCEALVIVGPKGEPAEREAKVIKAYLDAGGKGLGLFGPGTPQAWKQITADYGVEIEQNLIIDPRVQPPIAVATKNYSQDVDITKSFALMSLFPEVSSVKVPTSNSYNGADIKTFVSSEAMTFTKMGNLKSLKEIIPRNTDKRGPFPIAVLITKPVAAVADASKLPAVPAKEEKKKPATPPPAGHGFNWHKLVNEAQAQDPHAGMDGGGEEPPAKDGPKAQKNEMSFILIGNHTFPVNGVVNQYGNMDLFLNSISFLLKDQDVIGIRPREIRQATLDLTVEGLRKVYATILMLAGLFIVGGIRASRRGARLQTHSAAEAPKLA